MIVDRPPKTNMDAQNDGWEKVTMAIFGIYVRFLGCSLVSFGT